MAISLAKRRFNQKNEPVGQVVFVMLCICISATLMLPGRLLWILGINYITAEATTLEKVHPSTYLISITCLIWLIQSVGDKNRAIDLKQIKYTLFYLIAAVVVLVYTTIFLEGQLAIIADSFICPPLYVMILHFLNPRQKKIILVIVLAFVGFNILLMFYEFASGSAVLPPVYSDLTDAKLVRTTAESEFEGRASGFYGHPLSAGTMTLVFLVCCFETINQLRWRLVTLALAAGAVATFPTFGSRWALLLFVLYCCFVGARFLLNIARTRRISQQSIVIVMGIALAAIPLGVASYQLGFFDTLLERIDDDNGSAASRMAAWDLFVTSDLREVVLGDVDNMLTHKLIVRETTYGVEVFWLGFLMRYGLICGILYFPGLAALMYQLRKDGGRMGLMVAIFFLAAISGSLSILGKTQLFSEMVILAYAMMPPRQASSFVPAAGRQSTRKLGPSTAMRAIRKGERWSDMPIS